MDHSFFYHYSNKVEVLLKKSLNVGYSPLAERVEVKLLKLKSGIEDCLVQGENRVDVMLAKECLPSNISGLFYSKLRPYWSVFIIL